VGDPDLGDLKTSLTTTLFIAGEKTDTLSQRSLTCSIPVMCGASADATGSSKKSSVDRKVSTDISTAAEARTQLFSCGTG
jgi:hypothetical protein